jgi:hypothetical protein
MEKVMSDEAKALKMPVESDFPDKASYDEALAEWWMDVEYRERDPDPKMVEGILARRRDRMARSTPAA